MRIPRLLTVAAALAAVALTVFVGIQILRPPRPLIDGAGFEHERITPNADGQNDLTTFSYTLTRNATVSIVFMDREGRAFVFREDESRVADDYRVLFSGVVHGFALPGETIHGEVLARLLPDGDYDWTITAVDEAGQTARESGTLTIADADTDLPDLPGFDFMSTFTPNQDGLSDRVTFNVYVTKDAQLTMYLVNEAGEREFITERAEGITFGEAGAHDFDYDGGIDSGNEPPPDDTYQVVLLAEDAEGQKIRRTGTLALRDGGLPIGAIFPQPTGTTVFYDTRPYADRFYSDETVQGDLIPIPEGVQSTISDSEVVIQGDLLVFRLTITNDGSIGLRTTGPPPGTVYQQEQRASTLGWFEESGAWRVGFECETMAASYPWRWAIAPADQLEVVEEGEDTFYYLPPGEQAVVWGAVRLTEIRPRRNPQQCWFALIHEDVEIAQANVDRRWVETVPGPEGVD